MHGCLLVFFNETATTEIYTLSLHDALPICIVYVHHILHGWSRDCNHPCGNVSLSTRVRTKRNAARRSLVPATDRKSTRLNSSHANISYAVFCLKKKNTTTL